MYVKKNNSFLLAEESLSEKRGRILKYDMKELRELYVLTPNLVEIIYTHLIRSFFLNICRDL